MAAGATPVNDLARQIKDGGVQVIAIGDAKEPRKMTEAIHEGYEAALEI